MRLKVMLLSLLTLLAGTSVVAMWLNAPQLTKWANFFLQAPATQTATTTARKTPHDTQSATTPPSKLNRQVRQNRDTAKTKTARRTTPDDTRQADTKTKASAARGLDVARINASGTSVIAGYAQPKEQITITEDGNPIGTVTADNNGEWVFVTTHKFKSKDPRLAVRQSNQSDTQHIAAGGAQTSNNANTQTTTASTTPTPHGENSPTAKRLVRDLEALVEDARREAAQADGNGNANASANTAPPKTAVAERETRAEPPASDPPQQQPEAQPQASPQTAQKQPEPSKPSNAEPTTTAQATAERDPVPDPKRTARNTDENKPAANVDLPLEDQTSNYSPGRKLAAADASATTAEQNPTHEKKTQRHAINVPIPIGFVYREASFTDAGKRAVALLGEYVTLKGFTRVVLTGHADERGTRALNKRLSADRLETVAASLKANGFSGDIVLIPKGESEPFKGVDRASLSRDELYALDRRVELIDAN